MSPERLLNPNYVPNAPADVYSIGIVLFLIIVGHHPYFSSNAPHLPIKDFIEELLGVPCHIPRSMAHFSLEFQEFFDLVLQMIQRNTLKRVSFEKIYEFVCTSKLFEECRIKEIREAEKFIEALRVSNFVITSVSDIEIQRLDRDVSAWNRSRKSICRSWRIQWWSSTSCRPEFHCPLSQQARSADSNWKSQRRMNSASQRTISSWFGWQYSSSRTSCCWNSYTNLSTACCSEKKHGGISEYPGGRICLI